MQPSIYIIQYAAFRMGHQFLPFSMWNLDQIWHPMAVLKSAHCDNLKALHAQFDEDIWG